MSESYSSSEVGLTRRAVSAGLAFALMTALERGLLFVRAIVLARLLEPKEFGLMGMAFVAINVVTVLTQTGLLRAVIQRRDDPGPFLDTVWVVSAARGFLLSGVLFGAAPLIAAFFRTPEVVPVLRVISFAMILQGFASPAWYLLERELKLTRFALPQTIGSAADLAVTCVLAFQLRSVWAMVFGYLSGAAVLVAASYVAGPYRPRLRFKPAKARELYVFGKHIFRNDVLIMASQQVDRMAVGRFGNASALGLYSFAHQMATLPTTMLSMVLMRVVFPSFALIQENPNRVRIAFENLLRLTAAASFPIAFGLLSTAPELVPFVFGKQWTPMIDAFRILCFLGATVALERACVAVTGGIGLPQIAARASLLRLVLMSLLIVPMTLWYGIEGAALATTSSAIAALAYLLWRMSKSMGTGLQSHLAAFGIPAVACAAMFAAVVTVRPWAGSVAAPAATALLIAVGGVSYVGVAATIDRLSGSLLALSFLRLIRSR